MKHKFTPGPWYIHKPGRHWNNYELEHIEVCYGKDMECICDTVYTEPNARLIAAAPELYEVCKAQHEAIDILMARLIALDPEFMPSKSGKPWEALSAGYEVLKKVDGEQ